MNQSETLHPLIVELMNQFDDDGGQLRLSVEQFESWHTRLRELPPAQREPVVQDLAVLAARFQREAPEATDWAVHALMFFAIQLAGSVERTERMLDGGGLELPAESMLLYLGLDASKSAPAPLAGRSRPIDPILQQQFLSRRR